MLTTPMIIECIIIIIIIINVSSNVASIILSNSHVRIYITFVRCQYVSTFSLSVCL